MDYTRAELEVVKFNISDILMASTQNAGAGAGTVEGPGADLDGPEE